MKLVQPAHGAIGSLIQPSLYTLRMKLVLAGQQGQLVILLKVLQTDRTLLVKIVPENTSWQRLHEGFGGGRRRSVSKEGGEGLIIPVS